jgi:uncharacterized protein YegP (UPF0339 family)
VIFPESGVGREGAVVYFELRYNTTKKQYYWRLIAANGKRICWSEYYWNREDALNGIYLTMGTNENTPIKETSFSE